MGVNAVGGSSVLSMMRYDSESLAAELGGDVNAQVAAMVMVSAREKREQVQQSRKAEERTLTALQEQAVASMREQAEHLRTAGRQEGMTAMVAGAMQAAAAAWSAYGAGSGGGVDVKTGNESGSTTLSALRESLPGAGASTAGLGKMLAADEAAAASHCEADATEARDHADAAESRLDGLRDEQQDARELERTALDFLRDMNQGAAGADRAAIFQRV